MSEKENENENENENEKEKRTKPNIKPVLSFEGVHAGICGLEPNSTYLVIFRKL